jgi:hypothetical protein
MRANDAKRSGLIRARGERVRFARWQVTYLRGAAAHELLARPAAGECFRALTKRLILRARGAIYLRSPARYTIGPKALLDS